jgi:hypothetical protein
MPIIGEAPYDNHFDEHVLPDLDKPYYRECHHCGHAFRKNQTALMDYKGRFYCNDACINEHEEMLREGYNERKFQEFRDGLY